MDGWTWDMLWTWHDSTRPRSELELPMADYECKEHGRIDCAECVNDD